MIPKRSLLGWRGRLKFKNTTVGLNWPDVGVPAIGDVGRGAGRLKELDDLMTGGAAVGAVEAEHGIMGIQC